MPESSYDCIVIGSGPGGYVAAIRAAQLGMKTAVVEKADVGGRCLNVACIPAKAVLRVADIVSEIDEASDFGVSVPERSIDFSAVGERRRKVVKTLTGGVSGLMKKNKIDVIEGFAAVTGAANVRVGDETYEAGAVILATGSVGKPVPGTSFGGRVIGTEEAWALEELPGRLAVIGAGAAGVELDDRGLIAVDGRMRTSAQNVYAIGDLVRGPALAHKASDEGIIAVEDAAGQETHPLEYADIPRATFCTPNVGSFGLTEEQAREQGFDVVVGKVNYGAVGAGTVYGDRGGMIKIIGEKKYGELVGG